MNPGNVAAAGMDIQSERRRLLDAEGGDEDPTGLMSEQDAYLRSVQGPGLFRTTRNNEGSFLLFYTSATTHHSLSK